MSFFDQYPYTNFHNVNLDWILEKVKEWGELVEQNNTNFENLEQANEAFKTYVNTYLENLDVQTAIDNKLDSMFESGELTEYLQPYISPVVTTWLDQNITEPVGVVIDNSLTVAGAAAGAKAAGDAIKRAKEEALTTDVKNALLTCFSKVAYIDGDGQSYFDALQSALFPDIPFIVRGWLYRFNDNIISIGTEDFNFEGITEFANGVSGESYFHHLRVEGDSSTDPLGIYALNISNIPDLSEDFTISIWHKTVSQKRGHVFTAAKWHGDSRIPIYKVTVDNPLWSDMSAVNATISDTYRGVRLMYPAANSRLAISLSMANENKCLYADLQLPESIDTTLWHHHAITRNRGVVRYFFDGVQIFHAENSNPIYFADQVCLGNSFGSTEATITDRQPASSSDYFDDLYITNFAKWTSNFDPSNITY